MIDRLPRLPSAFVLLVGFLAITALSCSRPRVAAFEESVGRLTQDEFVREFGYPQRLKQTPSEGELWDYEFLAGQSRCVGYRVFFDQELRSRRWEPAPCR